MKTRIRPWTALVAAVTAGLVGVGLLALVGTSPLEALRLLVQGAFGTRQKVGDTLMVWVPLVLASAGLVVTFTAGMWNIGVEGQITAGAILATWVARVVVAPRPLLLALVLAGGLIGGLAWGVLAGALKIYGRVNEIFGGVGLNFVATGITIYLIVGPWKRAGIASTSGTDPLPRSAWLPTLAGTRLSPLAVAVAVVGVVVVYLLLRGTLFGLRLRAVGHNLRSAFLLGIPTVAHLFAAFAVGGALAGLAGAVQVAGFHHKLVPSVAGGYGFLGILVALLVASRAAWVAPLALFFAMLTVGATQLQLRLGLDSAIGGVLQGVLVLAALLAQGWQWRRQRMSRAEEAG